MKINGIEVTGAITLAVSGNTYPISAILKSRGYRWDARRREWARTISEETAAAMVADADASAPHLANLAIELRTSRGNLIWARGEAMATPARVGNCAACGSYGPLHRTPTGWVCSDCH